MKLQITKLESGLFRVYTGKLGSDCREIVDVCELRDNELRTYYRPGLIHTGFPVRVKLGPVSLAAVQSMQTFETRSF